MILITPKRTYDMLFPTLLLEEHQLLNPRIRSSSLSFQHHVENDENNIHISLDLPGMKLHNLNITEDNGVLQVTGAHDSSLPSGGGITKRLRFAKKFLLPDRVEIENIKASLVDGVLTIHAPKAPKPQPRQFKIESSAITSNNEISGSEEKDDFQLTIDVPGAKMEDIAVTENNDRILNVVATRKNPSTNGIRKVSKRFVLPECVNLEELKASLADGVLELRAPRIPKPLPRQITVESNTDDNLDISANDFSVSIDLPGVPVEDVKLVEENGVLRVSGTRKASSSAAGRTTQEFVKVFNLPDRVEVAKLKAILRDGVLVVKAPKTPVPQPRKIVIHQQQSESSTNPLSEEDKKKEDPLEKNFESEKENKQE